MQLRHLSDLSLDATRLVTVDGLHRHILGVIAGMPVTALRTLDCGGCVAALAVSSAVQR
jgi:hypothetical protein